jgi:hypothetical protein
MSKGPIVSEFRYTHSQLVLIFYPRGLNLISRTISRGLGYVTNFGQLGISLQVKCTIYY